MAVEVVGGGGVAQVARAAALMTALPTIYNTRQWPASPSTPPSLPTTSLSAPHPHHPSPSPPLAVSHTAAAIDERRLSRPLPSALPLSPFLWLMIMVGAAAAAAATTATACDSRGRTSREYLRTGLHTLYMHTVVINTANVAISVHFALPL